MSYDLLIKNGRIYDGSGTDSYGGNIAVKAGHIVAVGEVDGEAKETIEAYKVGDLPGNGPRLVQECEGMHYTVVNGDILVKDGKHTGSYPGRVLRGIEGL